MTDETYYHSLAPGTELNEYRIERVLGMGSFGVTYLGLDLNLNKKVAIKEYLPNEYAVRAEGATVMPRSLKDEAEYQWGRERFLDEARVLAHFNHPVINLVHRYFEANNTAYIVLEYIEGDTLGAKLDSGHAFTEQELVNMTFTLCEGLALIHQDGYVHRDIKPQNIVLRSDMQPVLIDFGAARQAIESKTKAVTAILTPGYAPVEQYDQTTEAVGPWSDIYALGMVLYRCVSASKNVKLVDSVRRILAASEGKPDPLPPLSDYAGSYSKAFLALIAYAIQVKEADRPQDVHHWLAPYKQSLAEAQPGNDQPPEAEAEPVVADDKDNKEAAPIEQCVQQMDFTEPDAAQAVTPEVPPAATADGEPIARPAQQAVTVAGSGKKDNETAGWSAAFKPYMTWVVRPALVILGALSVVLAYQFIGPTPTADSPGVQADKTKLTGKAVGPGTTVDSGKTTSDRPSTGSSGKIGTTGNSVSPDPVYPPVDREALRTRGRLVYELNCQSCHRYDGGGLPALVPRFTSRLSRPEAAPERQIRIVLQGKQRNPFRRSDYDMPSFKSRLNDYDVAAVLTYINLRWGGRVEPISPQQVKALR